MENLSDDNETWWKQGVIYHICPLSFNDSDGDGYGDLQGIIQKLDYLSLLGIDAIWLSPVYQSPMVDFGYDISDHTMIDPRLGTLEDFRCLLSEAHSRGIRVVMDLVMNHTSDKHEWFLESSSSIDNSKRDWYIWHDGRNGKKPNNWRSAAGGSAWQYDKITGQYFYHSFFKNQPDLNWRSKEMQKAFFEQVRFWLNMGVDGFRLDVINMVVKDKKFRNSPLLSNLPFRHKKVYTRNRPKSYKIVRKLRKLVNEYDNRLLVGEIYSLPPGDPELSASYLGTENNLLHLAFDFSIMFRRWSAVSYFRSISAWYWQISADGWPCNVLSNHDLNRYINRYHFSFHKERKARLLAVLLLTIKGTPFIYYGDEIGMQNALIPRNRLVDPLGQKYWPFYKGRDRSRTPMQWDTSEQAGFTISRPWLPVNQDYRNRNVKKQMNDPDSLLNQYIELIRLRKQYNELQSGEWMSVIPGTRGVLAYLRFKMDKRLLIILNFKKIKNKVHLAEIVNLKVIYSTHRNPDAVFLSNDLSLNPFEASIFQVGANL